MRFFSILLLFCVTVAGSTWLTKFALREGIEGELQQRARTVLKRGGFPDVQVTMDHLDGQLTGTVDRPEDVAAVVKLLREKVSAAYWPNASDVKIAIRPSIPPRIVVTRAEMASSVKIEGTLALHEEAGRSMLGKRLRAVKGVVDVDNQLQLNSMVLPFSRMTEFTSVASALLAQEGKAIVALDKDELLLEGTIPDQGLKLGLLELAQSIAPDRVVDHILVPERKVFQKVAELKVTRNRFGILVTGIYPNQEDRDELIRLIDRSVSAEEVAPAITDRIEISDDCGAAPWQKNLDSILPGLLQKLVGEMTAEFSAEQVRVEGVGKDEKAREEIYSLLSPVRSLTPPLQIVAKITLPTVAVASPELKASYEEGLLKLAGKLPNPQIGDLIEKQLKSELPNLLVKNEIQSIPEDASHSWTGGLIDFFAEVLKRIDSGKLEYHSGQLNLEGRIRGPSDRQMIQNLAVNTFPAGTQITNRLNHAESAFPRLTLEPEELAKLAEKLKALPIYFEKNSELLKELEKTKIVDIVAAVKASGASVSLIVSGYTDNIGSRASNEQLALRRADNVIQELVAQGLPANALIKESKEEDVSGLPQSDRWKSRRVEVFPRPADLKP